MKRILFIACLLMSQLGFGQCPVGPWTPGGCINFDDTNNYLLGLFDFPNDSTSIWQLGIPNKSNFNQAHSQPRAVVTDTLNSYPPNDTSSFYIRIKPNGGIFGLLAFNFKMDSDSLSDFGKIDLSFDNGITWQNAFDFNYQNGTSWFVKDSSENIIINSNLQDSGLIFTGKPQCWYSFIYNYYVGDFYNDTLISYDDTITFRFTFISDSIDTQKDGWMIDNMHLGLFTFNTSNASPPKFPSKVIPNPSAMEQVWVQFDNDSYNDIAVEIYTTTGQLLQQHHTREGEIPIILRDKGIYFYRLRNLETQEISLGKIVRL